MFEALKDHPGLPLFKRKEISITDLMNMCSISKLLPPQSFLPPKHTTPTLNHHGGGGYHPVLYRLPPLFPCPSTSLPTCLLSLSFLKSQGYSVALLARQRSPNFTAEYNILHDRVCDYFEAPSFGDPRLTDISSTRTDVLTTTLLIVPTALSFY